MADQEPYVLLDIKGLLMHAYHAGSDPEPATSQCGEHSANSAGFAFQTFVDMYPYVASVPPRRLIAVWDGGNKYRQQVFPTYKQKRKAAAEKNKLDNPAESEQLEILYARTKQVLMALGATQVKVDGVEADDVIAMLCEKMSTNPIGVVTVDADLHQLASERVTVVIKRMIDAGKEPVAEPGLISLNKSIVGDTSDEYPGVKGLGQKAWEAMVEEFGIDGMYELKAIVESRDYGKMTAVKQALPDNKHISALYDQWEMWLTCFDLACLHPELCYTVDQRKVVAPKFYRRPPNAEKLHLALSRLNSSHLLENFEQWMPSQAVMYSEHGEEEVKYFREQVEKGPICAFDYESYDTLKHPLFQEAKKSGGEYVDVLSQSVTGVSFCMGDNLQRTVYMPVNHAESEYGNWTKEWAAWAVQYAQSKARLVAHNASFEMLLTLNDLGVEQEKLLSIYDTALMASHIEEEESSGLKALSMRWLNYQQEGYKELLERHGAEDMRDLTAEQVLKYGCDDSVVTAHLFDLFWLMATCEGTWEFIREREFDFLHEQVRGYLNGVALETSVVSEQAAAAEQEVLENRETLTQLLGQNACAYNVENATNLFQERWGYEEAKQRMQSDTSDQQAATEFEAKLQEKRNQIWENCYYSTVYIPYQEVRTTATLEVTPKRVLQPVAEALGFTSTPPIDKCTKKFFTEQWFPAATAETLEDAADPTKSNYMSLLRDVINASAWRKKDSPEYLALAEFCSSYIKADEKVETLGNELNFDSPPQMQDMLYGMMGLPIRSRSKVQHGSTREKLGLKGSPSTDDQAVAMALAEDINVNDWRYPALEAYSKAKSAGTQLKLFLKPLPLWVHPKDNLLHPSIRNCGTVTHRPSGGAPNMLQLTKKDGGKLRSAFLPPKKGHVIVAADFNGQELRITASESRDPMLLDAYIGEQKKDVHSVTAAAIAHAFLKQQPFLEKHGAMELQSASAPSYETFMEWRKNEFAGVANDIRKAAKAVNFLIVYLGGYTTLAKNLLIPGSLAKELMDSVFARYKRLGPWQTETIAFARRNGYTQTAYGTRRHANDRLFSPDDGIRGRVERQMVNYTIQGCAADILKEVLSSCHRDRVFSDNGAHLIAPIYDELVCSVPRESVVDFSLALKKAMEVTPPGHAVPMLAEFSYGHNMGELIEVGSVLKADHILMALEPEVRG